MTAALVLQFVSLCAVPIAFSWLYAFAAVYVRKERGRGGLLVLTLPGVIVVGIAAATLSPPSFVDEVMGVLSNGAVGSQNLGTL